MGSAALCFVKSTFDGDKGACLPVSLPPGPLKSELVVMRVEKNRTPNLGKTEI